MALTGFLEDLAPFPAGLWPALAPAAGRILLGTGFSSIPHPHLHQLEALVRLDLRPDWMHVVYHGNAARLLGLRGLVQRRISSSGAGSSR